MEQAEKSHKNTARNPIIWVSIIIIGLIFYIFSSSDRGFKQSQSKTNATKVEIELNRNQQTVDQKAEVSQTTTGTIERDVDMSPGARARELISQARTKGRPYDFKGLMAQADSLMNEGQIADSHLITFFAAREGYVNAMMQMAKMSDPASFQTGQSLFNQAKVVQAYKWYKKAHDAGYEAADAHLKRLRAWAEKEAAKGNKTARLLLLNFN